MKSRAIELLKEITEAPGAPGAEDAVRAIFSRELKENLRTDRIGSIIHEKLGSADRPRVMLTAHLDEVAFAVQSVTKEGYLKIVPLGGWWGHTLLAQRVRVATDTGREVLGVITSKPVHFLSESERKRVLDIKDMYVDIGARDAAEVKSLGVSLGAAIVPESPFTQLHNSDLYLAKAFDNRVGVSLAIQAMGELEKRDHPNTVLCVGTVQEELGCRGAKAVLSDVNPDVAIVLEGTPADDTPGSTEDSQGALGSGIQIRLLDPTAIMNRAFRQFVVDAAEEAGITHQIAVRRSGGTDASAIHLHEGGVPTIVLGVPARYIHSHNSMIHVEDYVEGLKLIVELITRLDQDTASTFTDFLKS